jgi:hypothetical protein
MTNFRRDEESPLEYRERGYCAEREAGWYFGASTELERAKFNSRMADAKAYRFLPIWIDKLSAAQQEFAEATRAQSALYNLTFAEIMKTGEISEATSKLWDAFDAPAEAKA